ncbi:MAG: LysR family transcriptional regulator [Lachnospiraceae bacterium]|jgi:DNA-binding transcriptional LysR family regulator|nr:LysR family transcriptional regulator [Lachnospiraceae bacterium]
MDFKNLNTFIYTAELSSFTQAAEKLGYSQSTVSFQIKQLENELGVSLFERIGHTVSLTDKGAEVLRYAHQMNQLLQKMQETTQPHQEVHGHIRLAMADSLCGVIADKLFGYLRINYPGITIKIITAGTKEMFRLLDQNEVDFVYTLDHHIYNTDYIIVKEEKEDVHFVTGAGNPLRTAAALSAADLTHEPFILTEKGMSYRRIMDERLASESLEIKPVFEMGNTDLICRILEKAGNFISLLPDYATVSAVRAGKLAYLNVKNFEIDLWAQLLYHRDKWISPQMEAIIDLFTDGLPASPS